MVHNGIEYGLMQAYAEGFDILKNAVRLELPGKSCYDFDFADIAEVRRWGRDSGHLMWSSKNYSGMIFPRRSNSIICFTKHSLRNKFTE